MEGFQLNQQIKSLSSSLTQSIAKLAKNGKALAVARHDYNIAKAKKVYELKAGVNGEKGMSISQIELVIKGDLEIAALGLKRDEVEVLWEVGREKIMAIKMQLNIAQAQWNAEWANAGRKS